MRVLAPSSAQELAQMMHDAMTLVESGPVAIRYPRGSARNVTEREVGSGLSARKSRSGSNDAACIIAIGKMLEVAEKAADELADGGLDITVWDARSCAPLDAEMIAAAAGHDHVITIEDGVRDGGIGMTIADRICAIDHTTRVDVLGLPTEFIPHDPKSSNILARFGLDADHLVTLARTH
jgi:1-deoxy-D-xylulose-5-phosphate synthase